MPSPDPNHMIKYCNELLPDLLTSACDVDQDLARRIGVDVLQRAEALATLSTRDQDVLIAPFVEEVFDHKPLDSPLDLKAKVTLVVRNSLLEQAHHDGPLDSGIVAITEYAAAPLSHFLAARHREPVNYGGPNPFIDLPDRYPRSWACLNALTDCFADGGRQPLRLPPAPAPELPSDDEIVTTTPSAHNPAQTVFSAIDPRFDQHLVNLLIQATSEDLVLCTSALSRYSRNSEKLHRILEYLLGGKATILTTNYLIRPTDVWVRRGSLVKPDSRDPYTGIDHTRGLAGTHRKIAESLAAQRHTE
jgi:hypothetical protein